MNVFLCFSCYGRRNESWKLRKLRLMFTIPVIILPILVVLMLVYTVNLKPTRVDNLRLLQLSVRENYSQRAPKSKELVNPETFQFNEEGADSEVREVLQDIETSFLPPPVNYANAPEKYIDESRKKRETEEMLKLLQDYEGNVTSEEIVWTISQLSVSSDIRPPTRSQINTSTTSSLMNNFTIENSSISSMEQPSGGENEGELESIDDIDMEDVENSLHQVYPKDKETDETYMDANIGQLEFPPGTNLNCPLDENGDNGNSQLTDVFTDNSKNDIDKDSEFYMFWRGQGDKASIRQAQATMMSKIMDKSADPCEDFYQYACGNWDAQNPIPKDKGGYDMFEKLRESLDKVLKGLLDVPVDLEAYRQDPQNAQTKAKTLYQSCMDFKHLAGRGSQPLKEFLSRLGGWPIIDPSWNSSSFDWLFLTAQLRLYNNDILIAEWVAPDIKNSDEYIIQIDQSSLGLPTRDYFLNPKNERFVYAYKKYIYKVAQLMGAPYDTLESDVEGIITFETDLAKITIAAEDRRNVSEIYKRTSVGELEHLVPQIEWKRYLNIVLNRNVDLDEPLVIFTTKFFTDLVELIELTPERHIANYLLWRFVRHRVNNLDDSFLAAKQEFYQILFGREQAPPRWKNCIAQVNANMGMALGAMFVEKYFDENSKNDTLLMTTDIMESFKQLLQQNSWIDYKTKLLANQKVDAMKLRIGYPDYIMHQDELNNRFSEVKIEPHEYFENTLNILQHLAKSEQGRLGQPVNKTVWNTAPAIVNAYYSRNKNQIMFPAGILQPPFYHRYFPRSLNYGGIGVVIGHEVTHGFDDKGRLFDQFGNLHRWWMDQSILNFHERAQCLIDQYSHFHVKEVNMMVDGENTQGENIADNGGIKQAFLAYQSWMERNNVSDETLPGVNATNEQLFFLNFAQIWCGSNRPESLRGKLETAVHSPGRYRVIGTLCNSKDFARVFHCATGTPMNPSKKCSVW